MQGCFFHFRYAIFRKLVDLGLKAHFFRVPEFRRRVAKVAALAFLPVLAASSVDRELFRVRGRTAARPRQVSIHKYRSC